MPALLLALALCAPLARAQALEIPENDGWVTDLAGLLSQDEERALEALMESYRSGSKQEIALLTLPGLAGRPIEEVALETARKWGIGDADTSAGALLVVAQAERELRIEVGRGLEGTLTDSIAGRIIRDVIVPEMRAQRPYDAMRKGIEAIHAALGGDYGPVERSSGGRDQGRGAAAMILFVIVAIALARRRRRGGPRGLDGGSVLPWILASQLGRSRGSGGRGSIGSGLGGFGGGSAGGSFGGFGGGGGFSGGGASGKW